MGWMVWLQIIFLLCMVWFGFGAVLKPLAALPVAMHADAVEEAHMLPASPCSSPAVTLPSD
jgi:hypothetical protein